MQKFLYVVLLLLVAAGAYWAGQQGMLKHAASQESSQDTSQASDQPLYWVAPMDPNYKRDKPGKSPMGMDLIPVYAEEAADKKAAGEVSIAPEVENNLSVRSEIVHKAPLQKTINTAGYVGFDETLLTHVHPRVEGWIEHLSVKTEGELVKQGQKLFDIYSPTLVAAQEEYIAALKSNHESLIRASKGRLMALGISQSLINQLTKTQKVQQNIAVYAERSGFVKQMNIRQGMFVQPGTEVMVIGEIDQVWVIAEVFEKDSALLQVGQKIDMSVDAYPAQGWQGRVDYIYPVLNASNRTLKVRVKFDNPDHRLRPNMFAKLQLQYQAEQAQVLVPQQAVIRTGRMNRVVLALGHGRFKSVLVTLGNESNTQVEILSGLKEGDKIVTSAQFLIDSESSISADFERMDSAQDAVTRVWVEGILHDYHDGKINVTHQAVPEWQWPQMTMDLTVQAGLDLSGWQADMPIGFCLDKLPSGQYQVTHIELHPKTAKALDQSGMDHSGMDHSGMDHSGMDHSGMDHSGMDHSGMDHSGMDHSGMDHSGMDHSGMDHSGMDHSGMDHSGMDHSGMDHSGMDHSQPSMAQ